MCYLRLNGRNGVPLPAADEGTALRWKNSEYHDALQASETTMFLREEQLIRNDRLSV